MDPLTRDLDRAVALLIKALLVEKYVGAGKHRLTLKQAGIESLDVAKSEARLHGVATMVTTNLMADSDAKYRIASVVPRVVYVPEHQRFALYVH